MMNEFNERLNALDETQRQIRYLRLAEACLAHYPAVKGTVTFVAHNAGIVYRVDAAARMYLLKIAHAIGEGEDYTRPERLSSLFDWLNDLARETHLIVQRPVANADGEFVTAVDFEDLSKPFYCSLQHWLEGEHPRDPSSEQAYQIGAMMATLHEHGSHWIVGKSPAAWTYDEAGSRENFAIFTKAKMLDIYSTAEWTIIEQAVERLLVVTRRLGKEPQVWGPIHGDLHQENLIVYGDAMSPIDFGALVLGHYGYDLGVTLYHLMYRDAATRQALIDGYQTKRALIGLVEMDLEAFLCAAALANLAFNVELPDQRSSRLFIRNMREFATVYCQRLIDGVPFALEPYEYVR